MKNLITLLTIFFSVVVFAESEGLLNKLLAPGPLIEGHKKLEGSDCLKCHEAGKGIAESKCLECHKEIKPFLDAKKGFHGLAAQTQTCIQCHLDHKGRDLDTTLVDIKNFDHLKLTGYTLEGKHAKIKCQECHTDKRQQKPIRPKDIRFLGTKATSCKSCHKKDDVHLYKGEFAKKDCNACHGNTSWKENIRFKHDQDTKFKLVEKHAELKCNDCHLKDKKRKVFQYQWDHLAQKQCLSCHQDYHKFGKTPSKVHGDLNQCSKCHDENSWKKTHNFDHNTQTQYPLEGKHLDLKCNDCHLPKEMSAKNKKDLDGKNLTLKLKLPTYHWANLSSKTCKTCHRNPHIGEFSKELLNKKCTVCHTPED